MKFMIIGLGNFGTSLGTALFEMGHEVMGIDLREEIVEEYKDKLTSTVCLNSVNETALATQPINDVDAVIVAIGEDWAASIQTVALLKKLGVKRIVGRSLAELHEVVLNGLGINEIMNPELSAAQVLANHIISPNVVHTFNLTPMVSINEIAVPPLFVGQSIAELDLKTRFDITIMAIKHEEIPTFNLPLIGSKQKWTVVLDFTDDYRFAKGDHVVICGNKQQVVRMLDVIK